jgi:bifunctional UDP-N-acetylglucosamine pyrophosphorylase/glucosamine-1-phosphate N-acetyltransferase
MVRGSVAVIVLAAGKGTRMAGRDLPKALVLVGGVPILERVVRSVERSRLVSKPVVVVGYKRAFVQRALGPRVRYAVQRRQLGTGHAVACGLRHVRGVRDVVVLYSDHPFVSAATMRKLVRVRRQSGAAVALLTVQVPDYRGPRRSLARSFSRVLRDVRGHFTADVQVQDATRGQLAIREVNPCLYCFEAEWLRRHIGQLTRRNAQREYYLTDLLATAAGERAGVVTVQTRQWRDALGVNSAADLRLANRLAQR